MLKIIFKQFWILFLICSCTASIEQENLYGEWKYTKVEHPKNPSENVPSAELAESAPFISFSEKGDIMIMWGGKQLTHGKFKVERDIIRITEDLPEGRNRQFPFIVRKLTNTDLVFETMADNLVRVTAIKKH